MGSFGGGWVGVGVQGVGLGWDAIVCSMLASPPGFIVSTVCFGDGDMMKIGG